MSGTSTGTRARRRVDNGGSCMSAWMTTASSWRRRARRAARTIRPLSPCLLEQVDSPIRRFTADGAYDTRSVYELLGGVGTADIKIVIPPRRGAVPSDGAEGTWAQRNATLETIRKVGRQGWQRESGYRRQGAVENLFFRYKRTLGNSLLARGHESQKREARIGCNVLNRMAELGKPESQAIAGERVGPPKGSVRVPN